MQKTLLIILFFSGICYKSFSLVCDSIPVMNQEIIEYTKTKVNKKVDRGECWDLAAQALRNSNAQWNGEYVFGKEINYKKECVFPGDIMQFEEVEIEYTKGNTTYSESMPHHTAIIYQVKSEGVFVLAHQNTGFSGRKVGLSDLDLKTIISGSYIIFRPQRK